MRVVASSSSASRMRVPAHEATKRSPAGEDVLAHLRRHPLDP